MEGKKVKIGKKEVIKEQDFASTIKTSKGLREALFNELDSLRRGNVTAQQAREVARMASVILDTVRVEIEAARFISIGKRDIIPAIEM